MNEAIEFVMQFYGVSKEDALNLYWDEVEAYMKLFKAQGDNNGTN